LILAVGYLWIGVVVAAEQYAGPDDWFPALAEGLSYAVFFPLWVWLATVESGRLIQAVLDGRAAVEAEAAARGGDPIEGIGEKGHHGGPEGSPG
jgi:hypothetical protein